MLMAAAWDGLLAQCSEIKADEFLASYNRTCFGSMACHSLLRSDGIGISKASSKRMRRWKALSKPVGCMTQQHGEVLIHRSSQQKRLNANDCCMHCIVLPQVRRKELNAVTSPTLGKSALCIPSRSMTIAAQEADAHLVRDEHHNADVCLQVM